MPELPEVETIKRDLAKLIVGLTIEDVEVFDKRVLGKKDKNQFIRQLKGKTIQSVNRRAKVIIITLNNHEHLVVHLKMTGQLIYGDHLKDTQQLKETKVVFKLSNGFYLNYNDQRLFGRLYLSKDLQDVSFLKSLGPEPLEQGFTVNWLKTTLKHKTTPIKVLLMKQDFLAGIGNIYASEILFDAKINPQRKAARLAQQEIKTLHQSIIKILQEAIIYRGSSMRNYRDTSGQKGEFIQRIKVYAKDNEPCPICKRLIKRIVQAARSTFYCQRCQN